MKRNTHSYNIVLQSEPEGGFTVTVPTLPGCITYGKTLDEAREMAIDAITCYLGSVAKQEQSELHEQAENTFFTTVTV